MPRGRDVNEEDSRTPKSKVVSSTYYQSKKILQDNAEMFRDAETATKNMQKTLSILTSELQALDRTKGVERLKSQIGEIDYEVQNLIQNISEGRNVSEKEIFSIFETMSEMASKMSIEERKAFNTVIGDIENLNSETGQFMKTIRDVIKASKELEQKSPLKSWADQLQSNLDSLRNIKIMNNTTNLLKDMNQQAGSSSLSSRNELAKLTTSRDQTYDLLSEFCNRNMDLNGSIGKSIFSQKQAMTVIKSMNSLGVTSTNWMKKQYDGLVKLQEIFGENNILTQAIVDNTYSLKGGSEQVEQQVVQLLDTASKRGITLDRSTAAGEYATAISTGAQAANQQAYLKGLTGTERTQFIKEYQEKFLKQAEEEILNRTFTSWNTQVQGMLGKSPEDMSSQVTSSMIGGYNVYTQGIDPLEMISATREAWNRTSDGLSETTKAVLGFTDLYSSVMTDKITKVATEERARDLGPGQGFDENNGLGAEKYETWREKVSAWLSNITGSSDKLLEIQDTAKIYWTDATDTAGAILNGVADIFNTTKTIAEAVKGLREIILAGNILSASSNSTLGTLTSKALPAIKSIAPAALSITAVAASVATIYSLIKSADEENKKTKAIIQQNLADGLITQQDAEHYDQLSDNVKKKKTGGTLIGAGTGLGISATLMAIGLANGWNLAGWAMMALAATGTVAGAVAGSKMGKEAGKEEQQQITNAQKATNVRSQSTYEGTSRPVAPQGGEEDSKGIINQLEDPLPKYNSINGHQVSAEFGQDTQTMGKDTGGGYFLNGSGGWDWHNSANGWLISAGYNKYNTYGGPALSNAEAALVNSGKSYPRGKSHNGMDLAIGVGTSLGAATNGRITVANGNGAYNGGAGNNVQMLGDDGRTYKYFHLSSVKTKPGQTVKAGDEIGTSGNTGNSTGPHLHFQVESGGKVINPYPYFTQSVTTIGNSSGSSIKAGWDSVLADDSTKYGKYTNSDAQALDKALSNNQSYKSARFLQSKLAIGGAEDESAVSKQIITPVSSRKPSDYGVKLEEVQEDASIADVLRTMNNNFSSLETVIRKVSMMEREYNDIKDMLKPKDIPVVSYSS